MKNKWFIIIVSLALGIALIGVGFMLKWQEGYKLDTDEQVKSAIADLNGISSKEVKLLGTMLYQKEDCQYYLAIGKANLESFVYIFEEKLNHRFAKYYLYTGANFEQNCLTLRGATKGLFFVIVRNTYHHIAEIQPVAI